MGTKSKQYHQSIVPSLVINGLITGLMIVFLLGGAYVGFVFYHTVKDAVVKAKLPGFNPVNFSLPQMVAALPLTGNSDNLTIGLPAASGGDQIAIDTGANDTTPSVMPQERINILLLGVDRRPDEVYSRTDTMILVTIDPLAKTAGMLSIPRDLWVSIPGYNEDRINKAYFLAQSNKYPGGGPALAMKTVQYNLGVPVNYYAQVDFTGFEQIIDTLGGIDIYVPETIDDPTFPDAYYGYDPFYIEAGQHHLEGHDAMRYARTRHTAGSDFSRAGRQQQVLIAMRDKALQMDMITKIPELWATFSDTLETDLQLVDILELAPLASEITPESIRSEVIDYRMTVNYVVPDTKAQVLLPLREKIKVLVDDMFAATEPVTAPQPSQQEIEARAAAQEEIVKNQQQQQDTQRLEEMRTFLAQEDAKLVVQNGTNIANLAAKTALYLKNQGFNIVQFSPADNSTYSRTVIVVYTEEKNYTLQLLSAIFNVSDENIRRSPSLKSDVDFRVIVGSDFDIGQLPDAPLTIDQ
jgi:LCP family protein required for cell wall assembly